MSECPSGVTYLSVGSEMCQWGDISICCQDNVSSGVTYLSVPESG